MGERRGPEFTSFWEGLEAFAEAEVAAYSMFRTAASNAGRRRGHYMLLDGIQRIVYTYAKAVEAEGLSASGLWTCCLELSEVHVVDGSSEIITPNLHLIERRSVDGSPVPNRLFRRPALRTARGDSAMAFQGFANLPEILCGNPVEMQTEQARYAGWLTVITDAQMATDIR